MGTPVRYPFGVSTQPVTNVMGNFGMPDPTEWCVHFDDFTSYVAGNWTKTVIGTGDFAQGTATFGTVVGTNSAADNDGVQLQLVSTPFTPTSGKKAFFKARLKVSDATESDLAIGLIIIDTTILGATSGDGVTDGIFFQKNDGSTTLTAYCQKNTTTGQTSATAGTVVTDTFFTVGWYYNGKDAVEVYFDDVKVATLDGSSTYLPDATNLAPSVALLNGAAAAKVVTVDFMFTAVER